MKKISIIKTILSSALCASMLLAIGCGGGGGNSDSILTTGELQKDEDGNVIFDNVQIKLNTVVNGSDKDVFANLINKFNREYDEKINVVVTNTAAANYETTVSKQISNNSNPPDLLMMHEKSHKNFADNKLIQPFDEAMEKSGITLNLSDYASGLSQYSSLGYEGKTYSIPVDGQSMIVYYNKEVLASLGVDSVPQTHAELLDVCAKYKQKYPSLTPISWETGGDYFTEYVFITALLQNGVSLFNTDNYMVNWKSDATNYASFKNAFSSMRTLINSGYAKLSASSSNNLTQFMAGNTLFYFDVPWTLNDVITSYAAKKGVSEDEIINDTIGGASMAGWFAVTDNPQKNDIYGDSHFFAMTKNVQDINVKAAICEFIKWFTTKSNIGADWAGAGHISMSNVISNSDTYKNNKYVSNYMEKFYPDVNNFRCVGITPYYETLISQLKGIFVSTIDKKGATEDSDAGAVKGSQDTVNNNISFFG